MGRKPKTRGPTKGFTQLNAKLPKQLFLQFNQYWEENGQHWDHDDNRGRRDDLVVIALKELMSRKPPQRARTRRQEDEPAAATRPDRRDSVISFAHRQAKAIVDATAEFEQRRKRNRRAG
jgi:hypothetical protein